MAVRIIDEFKVIDIKHNEREVGIVPSGFLCLLCQHFMEFQAVINFGQGVGNRLFFKGFIQFFQFFLFFPQFGSALINNRLQFSVYFLKVFSRFYLFLSHLYSFQDNPQTSHLSL